MTGVVVPCHSCLLLLTFYLQIAALLIAVYYGHRIAGNSSDWRRQIGNQAPQSVVILPADVGRSTRRHQDKESGPASSNYLRRHSTAEAVLEMRIIPILLNIAVLLCSCPDRPHYGSCPSACSSVRFENEKSSKPKLV